MKTIEERATEYNESVTYACGLQCEAAKWGYEKGATEQEAITKQEMIEKACEWLERNQTHIISETGIWLMWTAFLDDFRKAMEK